ncbi:hypothetical protein BH11BAC2_BH11BAC2_00650 [soil metagenome]
MKKSKFLCLSVIFCMHFTLIKCQTTIFGNTSPGGGEFLGWNTVNPADVQIKNENTNPINFYTTGGAGAFNNLRARIFEDNLTAPDGVTLQNVGRMQISEDDATFGAFPAIPVSLLHLGHRWITGAGGHRTWMDVGTYTNARNDNMYFGLKHEFDPMGHSQDLWDDHMDAIISWGDNAALPDNFNDLRFIFATPLGINGTSGTNDGLETMRLSWNGNVGIGNFYIAGQPPLTNTIRPQRRLEVLDGGLNLPQFRLTHTQNVAIAQGAHVDFECTVSGDLVIEAELNGNNANVGINTQSPGRRLEVFNGGSVPQFRLAQAHGGTPRFTDFESTSNGDLIISPRAGTTPRNVGINTGSTPANTLEITNGTTGNSGLRFTNLTSSFTPTVASTGKVLTVDASGDVILVPDQGAGSINACAGSGNTNHIMKYTNSAGTSACQATMQEDANGFVGVGVGVAPVTNQAMSLAYTNASTGNSTGIAIVTHSANGTNTGINLSTGAFDVISYGSYFRTTANPTTVANSHKYGHYVDVNGNSEYNTGYLANITGGTNSLSSYGFYGRVTGAEKGISPTNYGVEVEATGTPATYNYGVHGVGYLGKNAIGVRGYGHSGTTESIGVDALGYGDDGTDVYGVKAVAYSPAQNNFGVYGYAATGTNNYGIYGVAPPGSCVSAVCTDAAGYFNGDVYVTNGTYITSDMKFKQNVTDAQNVSAIIDALQPKTYTFDSVNYPGINLPSGVHYGLFAQDVESILPGLVKRTRQPEAYDSTGAIITPGVDYKALNYIELVPILLAEIKTQKHNMDSVMAVLSTLLASPVNNSGNKIGNPNQKIELSNNQGIILNQNDPNPFAESTQITYYITENIKEAKIMFSDNNGRVLRSAKIETFGEGTLEVYASDLSSGIYTYTLICDGKVIDSKKMVKQ